VKLQNADANNANYVFVKAAVETLGAVGSEAHDFLSDH
jgi:hypothetical protein